MLGCIEVYYIYICTFRKSFPVIRWVKDKDKKVDKQNQQKNIAHANELTIFAEKLSRISGWYPGKSGEGPPNKLWR